MVNKLSFNSNYSDYLMYATQNPDKVLPEVIAAHASDTPNTTPEKTAPAKMTYQPKHSVEGFGRTIKYENVLGTIEGTVKIATIAAKAFVFLQLAYMTWSIFQLFPAQLFIIPFIISTPLTATIMVIAMSTIMI